MNRDEIYEKVSQKMVELFDLDPATIKPESRFEDLELTSIDAIDLIIELQQLTGRKVNEAGLRSVRTVDDLVNAVHAHLTTGTEPPRTPPTP